MSEPSTQPEALVTNDAEVSEFINSVELAPASAEQARELTAALDITYTAFTASISGLIHYVPLPPQQKTDSLYWTLFGQLAANAKFDRFKDPVGWNKEFLKVLNTIGMKSIGGSQNSATVPVGSSVDALILRYLKPFLSTGGQGKLPKIINALRREVNKDSLHIFNSSSSNGSSANFQVSDGTIDSDLNLTIHVASLDFKTHENIKNLLFWHWTIPDFEFYYSSESLSLSKGMADRFRQQVYDRIHQLQLVILGIYVLQ